jgi:hypothetical protein
MLQKWKQQEIIIIIINEAYENHYNPSEHLVADEIILKFKGRVVTADCAFSSRWKQLHFIF